MQILNFVINVMLKNEVYQYSLSSNIWLDEREYYTHCHLQLVLLIVQPMVGRIRVLIYFVLQHHINDKVKYLHCAQSIIAVSRCLDLAMDEGRLYSIRGFLQRKIKQVLNEHGFLSFLKPSLSHTARYDPLRFPRYRGTETFAQVSKTPKNTCENCSTYSFTFT